MNIEQGMLRFFASKFLIQPARSCHLAINIYSLQIILQQQLRRISKIELWQTGIRYSLSILFMLSTLCRAP